MNNKITTKPKIVFIDLDGTALDIKIKGRKSWISQENIDAIKKLQKNNINVVVSSGRGAYSNTWKLMEVMNITDGILWNGTKIVHNGTEIFSQAIDSSITQELFNDMTKFKLNLLYNSNVNGNAYSCNLLFRLVVRAARKKCQKYSDYKNDFDQFKIILWHPSRRHLYKAMDFLQEKYKDKILVTISGEKDELLEVTAANCSKGDADLFYANFMTIDPKECVHIGDGLNDAWASKKVGTLVAMGNSSNKLKEIADIVSPYGHKNGGLAKTFDFLFKEFLINE
ncbi:HAD-IIB family hydrolase [Mycoplasmopsis hyopharyngis]|uniref:HAD-IIB family hydrolase n=1 Tax=Mycoplasmopsis hyopharyngis TaxID=29558 RepID=UPI0038732BA1